MTDKVFIHELTAFASIGVYDWEHTIKQRLVFNLEMEWDFTEAVKNDDIAHCLNYAEVSQTVILSKVSHLNWWKRSLIELLISYNKNSALKPYV